MNEATGVNEVHINYVYPADEGNLLYAILSELQALRAEAAPMFRYFARVEQAVAQLDEPAEPELPLDFPGRALLHAAGIRRVADVPRTVRQIDAIPGMDEETSMAIVMRLAKR